MEEKDLGTCSVCSSEFDWAEGGNVCTRCSEPVCDDHTDWAIMRQISEEIPGAEGVNPVCTQCGDQLRNMSETERIKAFASIG